MLKRIVYGFAQRPNEQVTLKGNADLVNAIDDMIGVGLVLGMLDHLLRKVVKTHD